MNAKIFKQMPLTGPNTIRLLRIDPSASTELTGSLYTAELEDNPIFDALSYARGESNGRRLRLPEGDIKISDSCYQALLHLRRLKPLVIWVDAICMNYQDLPERQHHAQLTQRIYSQAENTYLWLGERNVLKHEAMEFMRLGGLRHLLYVDGDYTKGVRSLSWAYERLHRPPYVLRKISKDGESGFQLRAGSKKAFMKKKSLVELLKCPWNDRTWTFAEAVFATNPVVVCGNERIGWMDFAMTIIYLHNMKVFEPKQQKILDSWMQVILSREHLQPGEIKRYTDLLRRLAMLHENYSPVEASTVIVAWLAGLVVLSYFPKARPALSVYLVFSLIALEFWLENLSFGTCPDQLQVTDNEACAHLLSAVIRRKGTQEEDVYLAMQSIFNVLLTRPKVRPVGDSAISRELTECLMEIAGPGLLLTRAAWSHSQPSWVPCWSRVATVGVLEWSNKDPWDATVITDPPAQVLNKPEFSGDTMTVIGARLHRITDSYDLQRTQGEYDISEHAAHVHNYRVIHMMLRAGQGKSKHSDVELVAKELGTLRSMIRPELLSMIDCLWCYAEKPTDLTAKHLLEYIQHFLFGKKIEPCAVFSDDTVPVDTSFWPPWTMSTTDMFRVHLVFCQAMIHYDLKLFAAEMQNPSTWKIEKHCYGLCTNQVEIGDDIILVEGGKIPLIMRENGKEQYKLVCQASVFGMMHGEAWERKENKYYYYNRSHKITIY